MCFDLRDVAWNVVHDYPGGAASLGPRIGKNPTTIAHELRSTQGAKLGLVDAEKITQRSGDLRILEAFASNCGQMVMALPEALSLTADDCLLRLADTAREFGDLCREVGGDLADNKISDNELRRIDRECTALISSLHALQAALSRKNLDGKTGL